jgi:hypothetical protein
MPWPLRDVAFSVNALHAPVGIDHGDRVEEGLTCPLEEADRQDHAQFPRKRCKAGGQRVTFRRQGQVKIAWVLLDAEIRCCKQFLHQNHIGALTGRLETRASARSAFVGNSQLQANWVAATVTCLISWSDVVRSGPTSRHPQPVSKAGRGCQAVEPCVLIMRHLPRQSSSRPGKV